MKILRQDDDTHSPEQFHVRHPRVTAVVDLTSDFPPYMTDDPSILCYIKIRTQSKMVPTREAVCQFIAACNQHWGRAPAVGQPVAADAEGPEDARNLIAVHCHYGYNRTGFMICCYLVEMCGETVDRAVDRFQCARPPGIKHDVFIAELAARYGDRRAK